MLHFSDLRHRAACSLAGQFTKRHQKIKRPKRRIWRHHKHLCASHACRNCKSPSCAKLSHVLDPVPLTMAHVAGINLDILKVCRLFYEEGSKIFWNENTFLPPKPLTLVAELGWVTPSKPRVVSTEEGQICRVVVQV
ncbi:hypothetical protein BDDG_07997 [Blastomyces dermatitidis ATCC 18188]|nr:hypothetical protein BDDG_07997 [Blastomyces dermatitidis ATCC 18188]